MKKILKVLLVAGILCTLLGCSSSSDNDFDPIAEFGTDELYVFNWGEYIGEDTIEAFEEKYNVTVYYKTYDSNEEMYTALLAGDKYDVIYPSDYMIERLISEGMIQQLDLSLITNIDAIADNITSTSYDPDHTYSIPYFQGSVGLVYNTNVVSQEEIESQGWDILTNTDYAGQIFLYDADRDNFLPAFKALGYSMNTTDEAEIEEAYQWLLNQAETMSPSYGTDEIIDDMINEKYAIAVVYSGTASYILSENPDIVYYEPSQGTNVWSDAMCITTDSENVALAHAWIDFNLEYEVAYDNSLTVGYTSCQQEAFDDLSTGEFADISSYSPRVGYELDEQYSDDTTLRETLSELWIKVKAAKH